MIQKNSRKLTAVLSVWNEAWHLVYGLKWLIFWVGIFFPFFLLPFTLMGLVFVLRSMIYALVPYADSLYAGIYYSHLFIYSMMGVFFLCHWYLLAMAVTLGVRQSLGLTLSISIAFSSCMRVKWQLLGLLGIFTLVFTLTHRAAMLINVTTIVSVLLYAAIFLPAFCFTMGGITYALPLIIIKNKNTYQALIGGLNSLIKQWFKVIPCYLCFIVLMLICAMPFFFIAFIVVMPFIYATLGILFRDAAHLTEDKPLLQQAVGITRGG